MRDSACHADARGRAGGARCATGAATEAASATDHKHQPAGANEHKDAVRFKSDGQYRTGWQDGFALCKKR